jgi:hypothetical protein
LTKVRKLLHAIKKIFPEISVDFQVELSVTPDTNNVVGSFFGDDDDNSPQSNLTDVTEPLLPADGNTMQLLLTAGGNVETFAYQWFSTGQYPEKTIVHYHNRNLVVNRIDDYFDLAGIYIYYLNDRSDHN